MKRGRVNAGTTTDANNTAATGIARSNLTTISTSNHHKKQRRKKVSLVFVWICFLGLLASFVIFSTTLITSSSSSSRLRLSSTRSTGSAKHIGKDKLPDVRRYHVVFSTSCSPFQNWQSVAFFYFAYRVKQPGTVTRIVSGCTEAEAQALQRVHDEQIVPMNPQGFRLQITPDFGHGGGNQKYWNKPYGLLNYLETELGYSPSSPVSPKHDNDVVIILDPDMMLLKPITDDFSDYVGLWKNDLTHLKVEHGKPIAQRYEYGAKWLTSLKGRVEEVVGSGSPVLQLNITEADLYYPAGPPYLATAKDMYQIVTYWVKFLPKIFEIFPEFMAEMHGYSAAAAHLKLPHRLARGFMISTVAPFENFDFVDTTLNRTNTCEAAAIGASSATDRGIRNPSVAISTQKLPYVLHYCQRYALGRYFFSKYKLNDKFFDCDAPLMKEPPLNVGDIYDWYIFPNGIETRDMSVPSKYPDIVRNGWMMCSIIFGLNDAAAKLKQEHCTNPNLSKTWHFHTEENFQQMLNDPSNPFRKENG